MPPDNDLELIELARKQAARIRSRSSATSHDAAFAKRTPVVGDSLPNYEIHRELHRGGQGVVYLALQKSTCREVALKVMREGPFAGPTDHHRFQREVQVLAGLQHPNIVTIHDSGTAAGFSYYVMSFVDGKPIDTWAEQKPLKDRLRLFIKVADAIHAAHLRGVIHRDLKPGNILVNSSGEPQVLDFGLAKMFTAADESQGMTQTGQFVGSLPWASPEQVDGRSEAMDLRTDIYSLGVILHQLLTRRFPYEVVGPLREIMERIAHAEPRPPSALDSTLDHDLDTIVLKCLSKSPDRRYQSAADLAADLRRHLAGEAIDARRDSFTYVFRKSLRKYRVPVAVALAFVALLVVGFISSLTFWRQAVRERVAAEANADRSHKEAAKAEAVNAFMQSLLTSADPFQKAGAGRSVRDVLDEASRQIESGAFANQPEVEAAARSAVGNSYRSLNEWDKALEHLKKAFEIRRRIHGDAHIEIAASLHDLGYTVAERGDHEGAEVLYTEALALRRQLLPAGHPDIAETLFRFGVLRNNQGRMAEAKSLLQEALSILRNAQDNGGLDPADCLCMLGAVDTELGFFDEAETYLRDAIKAQSMRLGDDHPTVAKSYFSLGALIDLKNDPVGALAAYQESLDRRRRALGTDHVDYTDSLFAIAHIQRDLNNLPLAEQTTREMLAIRERLFAPNDRRVTTAMTLLAKILRERGTLDEAEQLQREAIKREREAYGPRNPEDALELMDLARIVGDRGRGEEALGLIEEAIEISRGRGPSFEVVWWTVLGRKGEALYRLGRYSEAEPLLREGIAFCKASAKGTPFMIASSMSLLGDCLGKLGRFEEGERVLKESIEILSSAPATWTKYLDGARRRMAGLYEAWGKPEQAADYIKLLPAPVATQPSSAPASSYRQ